MSTGRIVRFAFAGLTAALLAGCADSSHFLGDPLGNPFKSASAGAPDLSPSSYPTRTPSMPSYPSTPAYPSTHTASISSTPLAPPSGLPERHVASYETPAHVSPRLAEGYTPPSTDRTASIAAASGHGSWSTQGGMSIIAGTGDTASVLGDRYNVPAETLLRVNGLSSPSQVHPGTRLIIPVYSASGAAPAHVAHAEKSEPEHVAQADHASRKRLLAKRDDADHKTMHWVKGPASAQEKAKLDHKKVASAAPTPAEKPVKTAHLDKPAPKAAPKEAVEARKAGSDPTPTASLPPDDEKVAATSDGPEFRWPARGRIIQGFKTGGNDGINIAVPEGTSVKAAENGVVAYAGSEIKGFGNLVLIRHPNGYVTAYANNSDIEVKRGEQVKRGQVIAKSGQTGNVASPQLHFELRKGSTPVDPTKYLARL